MNLKLIPNIWLQSLRYHLVHKGQWLPFLTVPPHPGVHIHAKPRKSSLNCGEKSRTSWWCWSGRWPATRQEESILGSNMQLFPRHLLQTPVSLKIILLLPAHHKRFQVCPVLLYSESVWMKNRWSVPAQELSGKWEFSLSSPEREIKAPGLGSGLPTTISSVNHRTLFTPQSVGSLSVGKMF